MSSPPPTPRSIARLIVSRVILLLSALSTAARKRGLALTSPPPILAAVTSSRINLVKILPRCASCAALRCLILAHLLWPAMLFSFYLTLRIYFLIASALLEDFVIWIACSGEPH